MTIISALPFNLQNGQTADATQVMANFDEILNDVNNNAAHNGANNDITSLSALTTPITPLQGGTNAYYGAGSGTANAQLVATPTPASFTLATGVSIYWLPSVGNTGALTLNANDTGVTAVLARTGSGPEPLVGGEVISGQLAKATYDGTQYLLDPDPMSGFGTVKSLASATTTDLGTALSHNINITGTTTITAFGSTASLQRPLYKLVFSGALLLTYNATSLLLPGSGNITTANGDAADALYLGSGNWQILAYYKRTGQPVSFPAAILQGYISGLTLSTAGSSGTFGIAAGVGTDSTNALVMSLASAYTKTTASWAVGTANGALDTGAIAGTTWYHVYVIERIDTGFTDILFSLSATSPTLPTNYTLFRRIGSMKTDGSNHWLAFTQTVNTFIWAVPVLDANAVASTAARVNTALTVPLNLVVSALFRGILTVGGTNNATIFTSLQETDQTPSTTNADLAAAASGFGAADFERFTNTSQQIGVRSLATSATISITTYGWIDFRGTS